MLDEILKTVAPYLATVITLLCSWAIYELKQYIKSRTKNEAAIAGLTELGTIAVTTVKDIAQTAVGSLAGGKFTEAEGAALKESAVQTINDQITPALKAKLDLTVNDLPAFVESQTQSAVLDVKIAKATAGLPVHNEPVSTGVMPRAGPTPLQKILEEQELMKTF